MHGLVEIKLYLELPEISPTSSTSQVSAATQKITIKFYFMHDFICSYTKDHNKILFHA